jgi:hypothetical protein
VKHFTNVFKSIFSFVVLLMHGSKSRLTFATIVMLTCVGGSNSKDVFCVCVCGGGVLIYGVIESLFGFLFVFFHLKLLF